MRPLLLKRCTWVQSPAWRHSGRGSLSFLICTGCHVQIKGPTPCQLRGLTDGYRPSDASVSPSLVPLVAVISDPAVLAVGCKRVGRRTPYASGSGWNCGHSSASGELASGTGG